MPFAINDGVRLHWDEKGCGTPVLLVMGHGWSSKMWYPAIPALAEHHRVIWFDNRGAGESDTTGKVTIQQMAADAFAVMDAAEVDRAHLYGVSMGGIIVQEMALQKRARVRSLSVGCSGAFTAEKARLPKLLALLAYLPPALLKMVMPHRAQGSGYGSAAPPEDVALAISTLAAQKPNPRGAIAQSHAMADYCTTAEALATLTIPALVLHGDEDSVVPFAWGEELADILPNSRFVVIEGAGHNYLVANPAKANAAVLDFIREAEAGA